jgi:hypothetical protein
MKAVCVLPMLVMLLIAFTATAQRKRTPDSVNVVIRLHTRHPKNPRVDSVLVIFDRFDHTGAGVIRKIFHPTDNQITIPQVPEGRYYISIFCLGLHREYFNDLTFINKRHSNSLQYNLDWSEEYKPGDYVPDFNIDFTNLAITNVKSFLK